MIFAALRRFWNGVNETDELMVWSRGELSEGRTDLFIVERRS